MSIITSIPFPLFSLDRKFLANSAQQRALSIAEPERTERMERLSDAPSDSDQELSHMHLGVFLAIFKSVLQR